MSCMNCATYRMEAEDLLDKLAAAEVEGENLKLKWIEACDRAASAETRAEKAEKRECRHGWRGSVPDGAAGKIANRCPACGRQSLFLGSGGWLTCSMLGCKAPGAATDALDAARAEGGE